jgi:hypothetical protein
MPDVSNERNALIFKSQEIHEFQTTENLNEITVRTFNFASDYA